MLQGKKYERDCSRGVVVRLLLRPAIHYQVSGALRAANQSIDVTEHTTPRFGTQQLDKLHCITGY